MFCVGRTSDSCLRASFSLLVISLLALVYFCHAVLPRLENYVRESKCVYATVCERSFPPTLSHLCDSLFSAANENCLLVHPKRT